MMQQLIPLKEVVPSDMTPKQARSKLRREGVAHEGRTWEFSKKEAKQVKKILNA